MRFLVQRFHCGEEDDLADGVGAGEHHDAPVDAHAHAARGGHADMRVKFLIQ